MSLAEQVERSTRLFLDTAPVIYYVEKHPYYAGLVQPIFDRIDMGLLSAVTSPITLAECLVFPYRLGKTSLVLDFTDLIVHGSNTDYFFTIDQKTASAAADLRGRYNISLPDAFQIAIALAASCDTFLTNDVALKRVTDLQIIVLDDVQT